MIGTMLLLLQSSTEAVDDKSILFRFRCFRIQIMQSLRNKKAAVSSIQNFVRQNLVQFENLLFQSFIYLVQKSERTFE